MIILGIDPAIRTTGYGVISADPAAGDGMEILDCGVIRNKPSMPHTECLHRLFGGISELVSLYHPDCAVLEEPFVGRNAKTAIILGMARGGILTALAEHNVPAYAYTPSVAKRAATGSGSADKSRIAFLLAAEFGIEVEKIPLDSTDALALAMCHIQRLRFPTLNGVGKML
ncbi:MAG: crossover junction endodeoxyribonuclease RuvC [Lentisphaerae bacterium]|nr:crossover junction endodeoxyribonuclease RuvC [Lentisphaerota bacterium]